MTTIVMVQTVLSTWICLEWNTFKVAVTSNSLAKQNSFRKPLVLTQTNYQKLQRTLKRERKKRIFLFSNLQIPINFLLSLLFWHINEMFVLWMEVNNMGPQEELLFLFYVRKYFRVKKKRRQKLMTLINQVLFFFEMGKYASFVDMNMIVLTITKVVRRNMGLRQTKVGLRTCGQSAQPWLHESLERRLSYIGKSVWKTC